MVQISKVKIILKIPFLVLWIAFGALTMVFAKLVRWRRLERRFPLFFHSGMCWFFALKTEIKGEPICSERTLYVSNHISYLDVFAIGGAVEGAFVAKSEVAGWPVFGKLAGIGNTLFVERRASRAKAQVPMIQKHLNERGNLIIFPEGTSTSGDYVAKFRSSLFAATEGVTVQPFTIAYTHYDGRPMSADDREHYAWYLPDPENAPTTNNKPFLDHFVDALGLRRARVVLTFHPTTQVSESLSRKACAQACEDEVRAGLEEALNDAAMDDGLAHV